MIRCDTWKFRQSGEQAQWMHATVRVYRDYCDLLAGVVYTHWPDIVRAASPCAAVERLVHATAQNPHPRYTLFDKRFHKLPSYLRRAAIEFVIGQVSSFVSNYANWQSGIRPRPDSKPPRRGLQAAANPALYRGQMIKFGKDYRTAQVKVWNGKDWVWTEMAITGHRERHTVSTSKQLSPSLIPDGARFKLAVPFRIKRIKFKEQEVVCGTDLGINTTATASVVREDGTVVARRFIHPAADIDRRDQSLAQIRHKARQTGRLSEGFCKELYAKGHHRNRQIACDVARELIEFARTHNATVIVFEHLKKFRPKGGRKGSTLRQRFHGWLHRLIVERVQMRAEELGLRVAFVNPKHTSKYAFDGSGEVKRDDDNRAWATFRNGKRYNCDLSASYNIASRYLVSRLVKRAGVKDWRQLLPKDHADYRPDGNDHEARSGRGQGNKSARRAPRTPVTLSTLWLIAGRREREAATTLAQAS